MHNELVSRAIRESRDTMPRLSLRIKVHGQQWHHQVLFSLLSFCSLQAYVVEMQVSLFVQ